MLENADLTHAATIPRIRPTYRPVALAKLDQRTKEARLIRETCAELVAHVGGRPTAVQSALIERACQLTLRIVANWKFAETGAQTDHDSRTYLAWSNSLTRTLTQLGVAGATAGREATLADAFAAAPASPPARSAIETPASAQTPSSATAAAAAAD